MPITSSNGLRLRRTSHPVLYEVNTRVLLNELSRQAGAKLTLDKIPDAVLDEWAELGFDAVWLMGVWTAGKAGIRIARENDDLRKEYQKALPDVTDDDIIGSPYAVHSYTVSKTLGGAASLNAMRKKLDARGMGLILDFVSNHTARDHKWVSYHPEYYIAGKDGDEREKPEYFFRTKTRKGERTLAFGRDPYFPGWTDTAQLNVFHPQTRAALLAELAEIARLCDGVRCDMAMLLLNDVFQRTWGAHLDNTGTTAPGTEFWDDAIRHVREQYPEFLFIAEAYWNLEWPLQQLGFNYTYDKTLYDRLLREGASSVYDHLKAELAYQQRSLRFIENHDEPRAAQVFHNESWHFAAATIAAGVPGMYMLHDGELEGRTIRVPVQLGRRPTEPVSVPTKHFYTRLLGCLTADVLKQGHWQLLKCRPAWHENHSFQNIIAFAWRLASDMRLFVVNYAPWTSQCYIDLPLDGMEGTSFEFRDLMSPAVYVRDRTGLQHKGMYFDLPGYSLHIFDVKPARL